MHRRYFWLLTCAMVVFFCCPVFAADGSIESEMNNALSQSVQLLQGVRQNGPGQGDVARFSALREEIHTLHLLLQDKFEKNRKRTDALGSAAGRRHQEMHATYANVIETYLDASEDVQESQTLPSAVVEALIELLQPLVRKPTLPILGALPYRHLSMPAVAPDTSATVVPAYLSDQAGATEDDVAATDLAPRSKVIVDLAESLDWNPVKIYEWVKNNIATEWYWGSMKGAEETLRQKSGNDTDQAALMVALMRAGGYPSRYVRGVIRFFPDLAAARKLAGVNDDFELVRLLQLAGIPHEVEFSGQSITKLLVEHVWMETQVPYANYRGTVIDAHGKTWLALDTSIKVGDIEEKPADPVVAQLSLDSLDDLYIATQQDVSPIGDLRSKIAIQLEALDYEGDYESLLRTSVRQSETLKILPAALQFSAEVITGEYTRLPEALLHTVRFQTRDADNTVFFDESMPTASLAGRSVVLTYEPQTVEDQEVINSFGGLDNTPAYLIRLRPVIQVDGDRVAVGSSGLPSGGSFELTVTLAGPSGEQQFSNTHIMGNMAHIGIAAQGAVAPELADGQSPDAAHLLQQTAAGYSRQWGSAEQELADLLNLTIVRPMPAVVTTGGVMEVSYLLGQPHGVTWKGVFVDADFRSVETVGAMAMDDGTPAGRLFMKLAALQGSYLEGSILEETFEVDGVSTAFLMGLAADQGNNAVRIDSANIDAVLPGLSLPQNIADDITAAVNQNLVVQIPAQMMAFEDWTGMAYRIENPDTGEAGYMLSGQIAGGMTAWGADRWSAYYHSRMGYTYSGETNDVPESAAEIVKITATDMQDGTVGEALDQPLQVVVRDSVGKPVVGAPVRFEVKAGGGKLSGGSSYETVSDYRGVASAPFTLGTRTDANPTFWWEPGYTYSQQVGENIISAGLAHADIELAVPFTAYGLPGEPDSIDHTLAGGGGSYLTWVFTVIAKVLDQYGNSIANETVVFDMGTPVREVDCELESPETRDCYFFAQEDPCRDSVATYDGCSGGPVLEDISSSQYGASAYLMGGAIPDMKYTPTISCKNVTADFEFYSLPGGNCSGRRGPQVDFNMSTVSSIDSKGNVINAKPPGTPIDMEARMFFTREYEETGDLDIGCRTCNSVLGTREFYIDTDFDSSSVTFGGSSASHVGDGQFKGSYTVQSGRNDVAIVATGEVTGRVNRHSCSDCEIDDHTYNRTGTMHKVIYGVTVVPEFTEIEVAVNDLGQSTCDVPISYTIQPGEYNAGGAYVYLYRNGTLINVIISETQGNGAGTLARGYQFDDGATYTAEVILNPGGGSEIKSETITLVPGAVKVERLEIIDYETEEGCRVPIGGSREIEAFTSPASRAVRWTVIHREVVDGEEVDATIRSKSSTIGIIEAGDETVSGWITVRASDAHNPCVYKEARIFIGCAECEDGVCEELPGNGFIELHSIDIGITLGPGKGGQTAGHLFVRSSEPDESLYTPESLTLSTTTNDIDARYDADDLVRQVMAPEALVDIQVHGPDIYSINFYRPEAVIGEQDGLFQIDPNASTTSVWTLSPYGANGLKVNENKDGKNREYIYEWDAQQGSWSLNKANGSQFLSRMEDKEGDDRIVTEIVKDAFDNIASKTRTTFRSFEWGEAIVAFVNDPDGAALTTTTEYYMDAEQEGSYSRIFKRINPDGSWARYEYDDQGRKTAVVSSWLDAPHDADPAEARMTTYGYESVDANDSAAVEDINQPRTITEIIAGQVVARTYFAYILDADGTRTEIVEGAAAPDADYGDAGNQRTITVYYPSNSGEVESGRTQSVIYPDGRMDTYEYSRGNYLEGDTPGLFVPLVGDDVRTIVVHGTASSPEGIPYKTTRNVVISSSFGRTLLQASEVYDGSGYERIDWTISKYDADGRIIESLRSDGRRSEISWACCGKQSETDAAGSTTLYTYDDLDRVVASTRQGVANGAFADQSDILTSFSYDAVGRVSSITVTAGIINETTSSRYDRSGRISMSTDSAGLETAYAYSGDNRAITVTTPGNVTQITTQYMDGHTASVTGTAEPAQYYSYGVNDDGSQWTETRTGAADSPVFQRTVSDMLGRAIRNEKNGPEGLEVTENFYDAKGRLIRTSTPGQADTLYVYDELGNAVQSGLDIDASGALEPASMDRISADDTRYAEIDNQWWQQSTSQVYPTDNDGTPLTVSVQRNQISGLADDGQASESVSIDIHGNITTSTIIIDRDAKTIVKTIDYPDSNIDVRSVSFNGLLMEQRSKAGVTTTYAYDALGRRVGVTDPRTGTTATLYDTKGRVSSIQDAAGNETVFGYDEVTGRKISETNALGKVARFAYNTRSQMVRTWGDVPSPASYVYDAYGRMTQMHTYRSNEDFAAETFPEAAAGDITSWHYDPTTGLLAAKEFADGSQVTYAYTTAAKLKTRTWARQHQGQPLTTTYNYDPVSGELLLIDYSDETADIGIDYDRLGRQTQVTDAAGTRTFAYNQAMQLQSETITGVYEETITRTYEGAGVVGRAAGVHIGADYSTTYDYDGQGRFDNLTWNVGGQTDSVAYTRLPDADLLNGYTTAAGVQVSYGYEPKRNFKTSVENRFGATTISKYDYAYDAVGRRTSVANSGSAFAQAAFSRYGYNDRNELVSSNRYMGSDIDDLTDPVGDEQRGYLYDPLGNRTRAVKAEVAVDYAANDLNQYTNIGGRVPAYDDDGNMVTTGEGMTYAYNAENRLVAARPVTPVEGDVGVEFVYDYQGRRVQKIVSSWQGGQWVVSTEHQYLYDGWSMVKETVVPVGQSGEEKFYVWGLDLSQSAQGAGGVGGLLATVQGASTYHYSYDGNGNVGQIVSGADGIIAAHYEYDPFGNEVLSLGPMAETDGYRFSTKYFDRETGLYYYGYRYYDPELGRWINRDPVGEKGGKNLYSFSRNNPVDLLDLLGHAIRWHHMLPQAIFKKMIGKGKITGLSVSDIHNPKYGWMLDLEEHKLIHGKGGVFERYEKDWERWLKKQIKKNGQVTKQQIHSRLAWLMRKSKYSTIYKNGVQATVRHTSWKGVKDKAFKKIEERILKKMGRKTVKAGAKKGIKKGISAVPIIGWGAAAIFFVCDVADPNISLASAVQSNIPYYGIAYDVYQAYDEYQNIDEMVEKELTHDIYTNGSRSLPDFGSDGAYADDETGGNLPEDPGPI